jgi:hypothetical protein
MVVLARWFIVSGRRPVRVAPVTAYRCSLGHLVDASEM